MQSIIHRTGSQGPFFSTPNRLQLLFSGETVDAKPKHRGARPLLAKRAEGIHAEDCSKVIFKQSLRRNGKAGKTSVFSSKGFLVGPWPLVMMQKTFLADLIWRSSFVSVISVRLSVLSVIHHSFVFEPRFLSIPFFFCLIPALRPSCGIFPPKSCFLEPLAIEYSGVFCQCLYDAVL